jgi:ATP-dependent helicase/DNAse subunit B
MGKEKKAKKYLSASRIGTLDKCSWQYWAKYHLHLPDTPNEGMLRGSICHAIFELLLKDKHQKHYKDITESGNIRASKAVDRMVKAFMAKHPTFTRDNYKENYELIDKMTLVGLNHNFFGQEGATIDKPEQEFRIENKTPRYNIYGFMDKPIKYTKDNLIKIVDYKSSKNKFRGEELTSNIQAMMYSLAAKKIWPKFKKRIIQFLFIKFPKSPKQELEFTKEELKGFEHYLSKIQKVVDNFDEGLAKSNFAAKNNYRWLCGPAKSGWECPVKKPFDFYVLLDADGKVLKSSFKNDLEAEDGQIVEQRSYEGCPHFNVIAAAKSEDLLDF